MSLPVKAIKTGGSNPPWYAACADRHPVPHTDLEMIQDAFGGPAGAFQEHILSNCWIGGVADWRHQLLLRSVGSQQWLLALKHMPGSAAFVWPMTEKHIQDSKGGDQYYFVPDVVVDIPVIRTIASFDQWEACLFKIHSPAYQWANFPCLRKHLHFNALRLFRVAPPAPLIHVCAECGFWNLPRQFLQQVATLRNEDVEEGVSVIEATWALSKSILQCDDLKAAACSEQRVIHLTRQVEQNDANFGECEELDEVLERKDEKAATAEFKEHGTAVEALAAAREVFRAKMTGVKRARGSSQRSIFSVGGRKLPKKVPKGQIDHSTGKALAPPGAVVWRARTDGRWCGKLAPYPEVSRSWSRYTEQGALLAMLRELWVQFLTSNGMAEADCPIEGMFPQ